MPEIFGNDIDIRKLSVEAPTHGRRIFEAERDISLEFWQTMLKELQEQKIKLAGTNPADTRIPYIGSAANMALLFPDRKDQLGLSEPLQDNQDPPMGVLERGKRLIKIRMDINPRHAMSIAGNLKILFPTEYVPELSDTDVEKIKHHIKNHLAMDDSLPPILELAKNIRLTIPRHYESLFSQTELNNRIVELLSREAPPNRETDYIQACANARCIAPELFTDDPVSPKLLEFVASTVENHQILLKGDPEPPVMLLAISDRAVALKILVADSVKLTDTGIEIINHPHKSEQTPELPDSRRF
jgi:hypothetical protein